jgi:putative phosphoesterase
MLNRIAVVSDIHGNIPALESVLADMQNHPVDAVFNLGDHLSGPLWPKETAQFLMDQDWVQVQGNHDHNIIILDPEDQIPSDQYTSQCIDNTVKEWLHSLPPLIQLSEGFALFHGSPANRTEYVTEEVDHGAAHLASPSVIQSRLSGVDAKVFLCGHSHIPRIIQLPEGAWIINPGSVGLQAYDDTYPALHVVEMGSPDAYYMIMEKMPAGWKVESIAVPYDYHLAADQARKNHRPDWEIALLTGYTRGSIDHKN